MLSLRGRAEGRAEGYDEGFDKGAYKLAELIKSGLSLEEAFLKLKEPSEDKPKLV